ncbi:MAG: DUF2076 domain-containing protein [Silvibacterium sp.]|nr:DUF2076 domain-containing protein [Silvibacterium sp.]MBV8438912.1 DUF2076 domain-containing protein [Silvibacterium sp.]
MTPQEQSMLEDLIRKVRETQLTEKDPEAEQLLKQGVAGDPDAVYKLSQTVLIQNLALDQARAQIQQLQQAQQQSQPARATSFLGGLLGHRDPAPPPPSQPQYQPQYQQVPYQPVPPQYAPPPPPYAQPPSAAGSFLRSAATTAAGVAAGALAFEGIESLMHGGGMWGGGGWGGGGFGTPTPAVEETVINNYYDDPQRSSDFTEHHEHEASFDDRPEGHSDLKEASYHPDDDDDSRSFDDSQDDSDSSDSDFSGGDDFV